MQTLKVICAALLWVAAAAHPANNVNEFGGPELEWWENGVFYEITPRSFKDDNGDGVGDIKGIISKLDYLVELGVDAAWLAPIFKSPMKDFGYDISNYQEVDTVFGKMADLEKLFREAKKKGIQIILDFVPNHTSDRHEWFEKSVKREGKYTDYYLWADGKNNNTEPPNNWVSYYYGSAWTFVKERGQWYYHHFAKEEPDLNYRSKHVMEEMSNVLKFWLEKGASGFRVDAVNVIYEYENLKDEPLSGRTKDSKSYDYTLHHHTQDQPENLDIVYRFREIVDDHHKQNGGLRPILLTEAYVNNTEYTKYFKSKDGLKLGSEMPFNFVFISDLGNKSTVADIKRVIDDRIASVPTGFRPNWVLGNHDQSRVGSRFGERRIEGLLALVMTLPGIAVTYMGEEIGMVDHRDISYKDTVDPRACNIRETDNWRELSRDPERTPFQWDDSKHAGFMKTWPWSKKKPWLPVHPNYQKLNVALQKESERSTLKFYKELLQLRKNDTFAYGSFNSSVVNDNVFAYVRALNESTTYVVLINFGEREERIDLNTVTKGTDENLPNKMEIVVAGSLSSYAHGDNVTTRDVVLHEYDVIILKGMADDGKDGGSGTSSSLIANIVITIGLSLISMNARFIF